MSQDRAGTFAESASGRTTVLVGMSGTEVDRRAELRTAAVPSDATTAFLQLGDPSLSAELTRLADAGAETVVVIGVRLGASGPGHSWLRRIAAYWWRERAGHRPTLLVATRLVDSAEAAAEAAASVEPITGEEPGLTSPVWEEVTGHRHQVMVCRGPRCTAKGADETQRALIRQLMEHGLGDDDVLVTQTGCQFPCNQAPLVSVQPDDVWYGHVDPAAITTIVADHLVGGRPNTTHRLPRHRKEPADRAED
ncbi:(2Fe-2S) ferredoxin domain-containing protein [Embleya hyalina]|uniref:Ferredoxin, 2Fe-2S n=1 Tax=Embleya hyalina TaxID=516124 RepID=A0A401YMX7_9ACTN|nr:(2Fe-2S) ferredoxin domain-containing protein [Embleya hyalina]GCD95962.1 ferredoxin, 2Fe-2S [Embleya hyalina]